MPIKDILPLPSIHQLREPPGRRTAAHAVADIDPLTARHRAVREYMAEHRRPEFPIHIAPAKIVLNSYANMRQEVLALPGELGSLWLGNGNRRVAIAFELGWESILCTPHVFHSGPEYEHLRNSTPKVFPVTREEALELYPASRRLGREWVDWAAAQFEAAGWGHLI